ncbi:MAG: hypothetical protein QM779_15510 [Propionicimonas sp.]
MQVKVHLGDGRGGQVDLLAAQPERVGVAAGLADGVDGLDEHAAGAAGRVDDLLARLRVEDPHQQVHDVARGEELAGLLARGFGELPQQVLVGIAEDVAGNVVGVEPQRMEGVQQGGQRGFRQPVGVPPLHIPKDTGQVAVGLLYPVEGLTELRADVDRGVVDVGPVTGVRHGERLVVGVLDLRGEFVAPLGERLGVAVVPVVADPLEEHHREHVRLVVAGVDRATEGVRGRPERALKVRLSEPTIGATGNAQLKVLSDGVHLTVSGVPAGKVERRSCGARTCPAGCWTKSVIRSQRRDELLVDLIELDGDGSRDRVL